MICGKLVISCRSMKNKHFSLTLPLSHTEQTHAGKCRNVTRCSKRLNTMGLILLGSFLVAEVSLAVTFTARVSPRLYALSHKTGLWPVGGGGQRRTSLGRAEEQLKRREGFGSRCPERSSPPPLSLPETKQKPPGWHQLGRHVPALPISLPDSSLYPIKHSINEN